MGQGHAMTIDRRHLVNLGLVGTLGIGGALAATAAIAAPGPRSSRKGTSPDGESAAGSAGTTKDASLVPSDTIQTERLQEAINAAARDGRALQLPSGQFLTGPLTLPAGTRLSGTGGATTLLFAGGKSFIRAENAAGIRIEGIVFDGAKHPLTPDEADGLIALTDCSHVELVEVTVKESLLNGISLRRCSGRITDSQVSRCSATGIFSLDAKGLSVLHSSVLDCSNNGIQIWREKSGEDGSIVSGNRIERIAARSGGTGENGNGVNVFRAGNVMVSGNRIADCAYSAVRGNAASNIQIIANNCQRIGEVALYAEFAFEGALIANNLIDTAASGIEVTNFNDGGRLAVIQGNLIRNLFRREHEPEDKRGDGIGIEADAVVSNNVIENAPTAGMIVGWGKYMRNVLATGNLIRNARIGVMVTVDPAAGRCVISNNMIVGTTEGAVRSMDHGVPLGLDLVNAKPGVLANITLAGNVTA